jgi:hypothetical protein
VDPSRLGQRKKLRRLDAHLICLDETSFLMMPVLRRTWAPCGETPTIRPFRDGHHIYRSRFSARCPLMRPELPGEFKEVIMIDALARALVAVALNLPALITATMGGSREAN